MALGGVQVYGLPFGFSRLYQRNVGVPMRNAFKKLFSPLAPVCAPVSLAFTSQCCGLRSCSEPWRPGPVRCTEIAESSQQWLFVAVLLMHWSGMLCIEAPKLLDQSENCALPLLKISCCLLK